MVKIVLASDNIGKITEIQALLRELSIELIPQSEFNIASIEETGSTFVENALIKARHAARCINLPVIADDSGLVIGALNGAPGVFSARYAGVNASDQDRINKVLNELVQRKAADRRAFFHCVMVFMKHPLDPVPFICQGQWRGEILSVSRGSQGFGYDPIFYVPTHRCSAAELDPIEKNMISHRGQAVQQLRDFLVKCLA